MGRELSRTESVSQLPVEGDYRQRMYFWYEGAVRAVKFPIFVNEYLPYLDPYYGIDYTVPVYTVRGEHLTSCFRLTLRLLKLRCLRAGEMFGAVSDELYVRSYYPGRSVVVTTNMADAKLRPGDRGTVHATENRFLPTSVVDCLFGDELFHLRWYAVQPVNTLPSESGRVLLRCSHE